jgi:hypothetical protein
LTEQFGRPHLVTQSLLREIMEGPALSSGDIDGLRRLTQIMRNGWMALTQFSGSEELDCMTNMTRIVMRLPRVLQVKWANVAEDFMVRGRNPSFVDLLEFLEKRVSAASNMYGQIANNSGKGFPSRFIGRVTDYPHNVSVVSTEKSRLCECCRGEHDLESCREFGNRTWEEKRQILRENKRCFRCLKLNHTAQACRVIVKCLKNDCGGHHHTIMHRPFLRFEPSTGNCSATHGGNTTVSLGFVPVKVLGPKGSISTYAFVDNGSDTTFILDTIVDRLGLPKHSEEIRVNTFTGNSSFGTDAVAFRLESLVQNVSAPVDKAYSVKTLPMQNASLTLTSDLNRWHHLRDLKLLSLPDRNVGLLIGCNVPEVHRVDDQRLGSRSEPFASKSPFGWIIRGPTNANSSATSNVNCIDSHRLSLKRQLLDIYELDFKEFVDDVDPTDSLDDKRAMNIIESSATVSGGHYEISLPWKCENTQLSGNRTAVENRLYLLRKRLIKDNGLRQQYCEILQDHLNKGYISKVTYVDQGVPRWFLPHHPVMNPNKPGKVRVVFDCAATFNGMSLNKMLLQGPDVANKLTGVLLRFRERAVAISADIQEMFLQVRIPQKHRRALSFLWWDSGLLDGLPEIFEMNVHPFGAVSSPFCANYALRRTAADNEHRFSKKAKMVVYNNFYVDDCLVSVDTIHEAQTLVKELNELLTCGGFFLTKWISNFPEVLVSIPKADQIVNIKDLDLRQQAPQKALGLSWDVYTDCFMVNVAIPVKSMTRRGLLSSLSSLYDPLGYLAPLLLPAKNLMQDLCRRSLGWDDDINSHEKSIWEKWLHSIGLASGFKIPRCLHPSAFCPTNYELHMFSDASETGYGAVGYLKMISTEGRVHCSFLMGKSRVAPIKYVSIPRLELVAAVLATKLMKHLLQELSLPITRTVPSPPGSNFQGQIFYP